MKTPSYNNGNRIMLEILNSYVPIIIRQRLAKSPESLTAAEYQSVEAGVLLADISGFTRLTEELVRTGPRGVEKVSVALNDYFGRWINIISEYGGDVLKFAGDAILAIWPVAARTGGLRGASLQPQPARSKPTTLYADIKRQRDILWSSVPASRRGVFRQCIWAVCFNAGRCS